MDDEKMNEYGEKETDERMDGRMEERMDRIVGGADGRTDR